MPDRPEHPVDMSPEAIDARINAIVQLRTLAVELRRAYLESHPDAATDEELRIAALVSARRGDSGSEG